MAAYVQAEEGAEIAALNAEAGMPIEELLAMYKGMRSGEGMDDLSDADSGEFEQQQFTRGTLQSLSALPESVHCLSSYSVPYNCKAK